MAIVFATDTPKRGKALAYAKRLLTSTRNSFGNNRPYSTSKVSYLDNKVFIFRITLGFTEETDKVIVLQKNFGGFNITPQINGVSDLSDLGGFPLDGSYYDMDSPQGGVYQLNEFGSKYIAEKDTSIQQFGNIYWVGDPSIFGARKILSYRGSHNNLVGFDSSLNETGFANLLVNGSYTPYNQTVYSEGKQVVSGIPIYDPLATDELVVAAAYIMDNSAVPERYMVLAVMGYYKPVPSVAVISEDPVASTEQAASYGLSLFFSKDNTKNIYDVQEGFTPAAIPIWNVVEVETTFTALPIEASWFSADGTTLFLDNKKFVITPLASSFTISENTSVASQTTSGVQTVAYPEPTVLMTYNPYPYTYFLDGVNEIDGLIFTKNNLPVSKFGSFGLIDSFNSTDFGVTSNSSSRFSSTTTRVVATPIYRPEDGGAGSPITKTRFIFKGYATVYTARFIRIVCKGATALGIEKAYTGNIVAASKGSISTSFANNNTLPIGNRPILYPVAKVVTKSNAITVFGINSYGKLVFKGASSLSYSLVVIGKLELQGVNTISFLYQKPSVGFVYVKPVTTFTRVEKYYQTGVFACLGDTSRSMIVPYQAKGYLAVEGFSPIGLSIQITNTFKYWDYDNGLLPDWEVVGYPELHDFVTWNLTPTDVGVYNLVATLNYGTYSGSASCEFAIEPIVAASIPNFVATFNGNSTEAYLQIEPYRGISYTYDGNIYTNGPTNAGVYAVVATIDWNGWFDVKTYSLIINKALPSVQVVVGNSITKLQPLSAANLTINFTADSIVFPNGTTYLNYITWNPLLTTYPVNIGANTITATFTSPDSNYSNASDSDTITATSTVPTITLNPVYPSVDGTFELSVTSNSSGSVTFSLVNDISHLADITSPSTYTAQLKCNKAGDVVIRVTQAASGVYSSKSFDTITTIAKGEPYVYWIAPARSLTYGEAIGTSRLDAIAYRLNGVAFVSTQGVMRYYDVTNGQAPVEVNSSTVMDVSRTGSLWKKRILYGIFTPNDTLNYIASTSTVNLPNQNYITVIPANQTISNVIIVGDIVLARGGGSGFIDPGYTDQGVPIVVYSTTNVSVNVIDEGITMLTCTVPGTYSVPYSAPETNNYNALTLTYVSLVVKTHLVHYAWGNIGSTPVVVLGGGSGHFQWGRAGTAGTVSLDGKTYGTDNPIRVSASGKCYNKNEYLVIADSLDTSNSLFVWFSDLLSILSTPICVGSPGGGGGGGGAVDILAGTWFKEVFFAFSALGYTYYSVSFESAYNALCGQYLYFSSPDYGVTTSNGFSSFSWDWTTRTAVVQPNDSQGFDTQPFSMVIALDGLTALVTRSNGFTETLTKA